MHLIFLTQYLVLAISAAVVEALAVEVVTIVNDMRLEAVVAIGFATVTTTTIGMVNMNEDRRRHPELLKCLILSPRRVKVGVPTELFSAMTLHKLFENLIYVYTFTYFMYEGTHLSRSTAEVD